MGSTYVNDFNILGRTYRVIAQALVQGCSRKLGIAVQYNYHPAVAQHLVSGQQGQKAGQQGARKRAAAAVADGLAEGILNRMVRAQLSPASRSNGKLTYRIRIENASPLVLNGIAVLGRESESTESKVLSGISISPQRSMTLPATEEGVKLLGLKKGIRVIAADLSAL